MEDLELIENYFKGHNNDEQKQLTILNLKTLKAFILVPHECRKNNSGMEEKGL